MLNISDAAIIGRLRSASYSEDMTVADLDRGRAGSASPPLGRRTDAVTVLLTSENVSVLWRCRRQLT